MPRKQSFYEKLYNAYMARDIKKFLDVLVEEFDRFIECDFQNSDDAWALHHIFIDLALVRLKQGFTPEQFTALEERDLPSEFADRLSMGDLAKVLGRSKSTIHAWIHAGQ